MVAEYGAMLMEGLSVRRPEPGEATGTPGKHVNVLQHLMGSLENHLYSEGKQELLGLIEDYRQGRAQHPDTSRQQLQKPRGGFCQGARRWRAALNRYPVPDWVHQQVYLHP